MKLCIDIGATNTRVALVNKLLKVSNLKVFKTESPNNTMDKIINHIELLSYSSINISTCGPIDIESGEYGNLPNLENWNGFNIKDYLICRVNCPIYIENDANCATLFEYNSNSKVTNMAYITLSTGVGAGAIIDKELLRGQNNNAMSPYKYYLSDSQTVDFLCSGTALLRQVQLVDSVIQTTEQVFAHANKEEVRKILTNWVNNLAIYINNLNSILDTDLIVLGGSVITNNQGYMLEIQEQLFRLNCSVKLQISMDFNYNALKGAYLIDKFIGEKDEESTCCI